MGGGPRHQANPLTPFNISPSTYLLQHISFNISPSTYLLFMETPRTILLFFKRFPHLYKMEQLLHPAKYSRE